MPRLHKALSPVFAGLAAWAAGGQLLMQIHSVSLGADPDFM